MSDETPEASSEIAEAMVLPPALEAAWHTRGYYGSVSHNVKAIYQRYMGWYDANPANLWQHPPVQRAVRYVAAMGGVDALLTAARGAFEAGDYRWAAELASHLVFAEPDHAPGKELLAATFEQLGFGAENGTWRCAYLSGAHELRHGSFGGLVHAGFQGLDLFTLAEHLHRLGGLAQVPHRQEHTQRQHQHRPQGPHRPRPVAASNLSITAGGKPSGNT